jgi:hypothetical protein
LRANRCLLGNRGADGTLYHQWETGVGTFTWSGWASQGNPAAGGLVDHPVLAPSADGRLELFVTDADHWPQRHFVTTGHRR